MDGQFHDYIPDCIIRYIPDFIIRTGGGHLILATKDYDEREAVVERATAHQWVEAVNAVLLMDGAR